MATRKIDIITGKVEWDKFGIWADVDKGLFIDFDTVTNIFDAYEGKTIRVTIEEIEKEID